jgi:hypothetical protein
MNFAVRRNGANYSRGIMVRVALREIEGERLDGFDTGEIE